MIKVLIVDDSAFMRMIIRNILETDPSIKVAGIARSGIEAIEKASTLNPDVITMDITMQDMDGIRAVDKIISQNPIPIVMVSAITRAGAKATIEALEKGAVDYISKDELKADTLLHKIHIAASTGSQNVRNADIPIHSSVRNPILNIEQTFSIVGIGISTGGPKALNQVIPFLRADLPVGMLIAQHMPPLFTRSLAEHLDSISKIKVTEARNEEKILPGHIYICPGGMHMMVENQDIIALHPKAAFKHIYAPSADLLMASIGNIYGSRGLCIIMTGMGADGMDGIQSARKKGSYVLAQSESSSIIYGMPKAIIENNLHDEIVDLKNMAERINCLCSNR